MLKVAVIIERADITLGGAERSVSELTAELRRQGVEATILATKGTESESVRVLCQDVPSKRTRLAVYEKAIRKHLKNNHYDIIHSTLPLTLADIYQPRGGSYKETMLQNIASYSNPFLRKIKLWTHWLNLHRTEYLKAEQALCSDSAVTIAALSDYVKSHFIKHNNLSENRIVVIPLGITLKDNEDLDTDKNRTALLNNFSDTPSGKDVCVFLFAANNPRLKGLRTLLYAFSELVIRQENVHPVLIIAGRKGLGSFESLVGKLGLSSHVHSLCANEGIWEVLSGSDVAVLPTYYDTGSRFTHESLAMSKPVITTVCNGGADRIEHLRHGYIMQNPDDYRDLADALIHFCDRKQIELAHKAIVEDNLRDEVSIRNHVEKLVELYKSILNQKKNR